MKTLLTIEEFSKISGKSEKEILSLCKEKKLNCKKSEGNIYIEVDNNNQLIPLNEVEIVTSDDIQKKTLATFLTMHEKVLMAKDETIEALKEENKFLKESIYSIQEVYEEAKVTVERLQKQLEITQEELEFCRRKYKLMWGRVLKKEDEKSENK
jgi:phosphatidate phosphatase PAH1